ncbi:hypothetical protein DFH05DRAFT_166675 [Lentinula detonsa]|uniref:Protein kinase domain-containing protein n=1 Tax=Lentinula detonsa TaxID=2804962 RepID=A0A9W8PCK0_9AGAR|nr:hypothetical protein DFH05DRAFT_166675 [Lentinula detonsa]
MHLRPSWLKLVAVASLFIVAGAIPYKRSKYSNNASRDQSPKLVSSNASSLEKRGDTTEQAFANEWYNQLDCEDWIDYSRGSMCVGYGTNRKKFMRNDLTAEIADRKSFVKIGNHNRGLFTLPKRKDSIAKIVKIEGLESENAACEVQSLKDFGQKVEAGFTTLPGQPEPFGVIIMKRVSGVSIWDTPKWKKLTATSAKRLDYINSLKPKVSDVIYNFLLKGKPLFTDFDPSNILIDKDENVRLVDFGYPGIWPVKTCPKRDIFDKWFERRWYFLWEPLYEKAGNKIPAECQWNKNDESSTKASLAKSISKKLPWKGKGRGKRDITARAEETICYKLLTWDHRPL